ncbi:MAG: hypothetical protein IJ497_11500 [Clostridia bacterium]|nr:hypothetical protein [Clostridia bacterium]
MKKILALLLAALMIASTVSCAADPAEETQPEADTPAAEAVTESETETEKLYLDNLPEDLSFGDSDFNILVRSEREDTTFAFELIGETVNDAIAERTLALEDRLDITFMPVALVSDKGQWNTAIAGSAQAADGAYDVVLPDYWWGIELGGYYADLNQIKYFDFSQPYWCDGWNDNNEIYGKLYTAVGDWSLDLILQMEAVYFNQRMLTELQLDSPYDLVKEDKWVHDNFIKMVEAGHQDLNGDGKYKPGDDVFGLTYNLHGGRGFLYAYGMELGQKNAEGEWTLDYYNDRFVKLYDTVYQMHNDSGFVYYGSSDGLVFSGGSTMFQVAVLDVTRGALREMEDDFGLVPYPKLDEAQEDFITFNLGTAYMAIIKSAKNPEMSAAVMEAMSAANRKTVIPVLFEDALKDKYSRDSTAAEMLDILQRTIRFDFAFVNDAALGALCNKYFDAINSKKPVASTYKSLEKVSQKYLQKLLESYQDEE